MTTVGWATRWSRLSRAGVCSTSERCSTRNDRRSLPRRARPPSARAERTAGWRLARSRTRSPSELPASRPTLPTARSRPRAPARSSCSPRTGRARRRSRLPRAAPTPTELTSTSTETSSGYERASSMAMLPPREWPTTTAGEVASARLQAANILARAAALPARLVAGRGWFPQPGRSGATTRKLGERRSATGAQESPRPGWPCTRRTTGPRPASMGTAGGEPVGSGAAPTPSSARRGEAPGEALDAPERDEGERLGHGVGRHLRAAEGPVDEADRHLLDLRPRLEGPVGHLDLEAVAVGSDRREVDLLEDARRIGAVARRGVLHGQAQHHRCEDVPSSRDQPSREAPVRDRAARDVAGADDDVLASLERCHDRGEGSGVVGEVRVHLHEDVVAPLEAPAEAVPVGAA